MSESTVTDGDIEQVLAALALNYNRPLDDVDTIEAMLVLWRAGIGGCAIEDVVAGLDRIMLDEKVDRFPTVAQFRAAAIAANRARRHRASGMSPADSVACLTCKDSGWVELGNAEDGTFWVKACPNGCKPPLAHHRQRPATFRSKRTGPAPAAGPEQLALSRETLKAAIAGQHRATGDRDEF